MSWILVKATPLPSEKSAHLSKNSTKLICLILRRSSRDCRNDSSGDSSISQSSFPVKVAVQQADFFRIEGGVDMELLMVQELRFVPLTPMFFQIGHSLTFNGKYSVKLQNAEIVYGVPWFLGLLQFNNTAYLERHDDYKDTYYGVFHGIRFSVGRTRNLIWLISFNLIGKRSTICGPKR